MFTYASILTGSPHKHYEEHPEPGTSGEFPELVRLWYDFICDIRRS